jgi:hypothetical protein
MAIVGDVACVQVRVTWLITFAPVAAGMVLHYVQRRRTHRFRIARPNDTTVAGQRRGAGGSNQRRRRRVPRVAQQQQEDGRRAGRQGRCPEACHAADRSNEDEEYVRCGEPCDVTGRHVGDVAELPSSVLETDCASRRERGGSREGDDPSGCRRRVSTKRLRMRRRRHPPTAKSDFATAFLSAPSAPKRISAGYRRSSEMGH